MTGYYFILNKKDLMYAAIILDCDLKHKSESSMSTALSVAELTNDEVMVKIKNGNDEWLTKLLWNAKVLHKFGPDDKEERQDYYYANAKEFVK